jgi:hypothetical protein
MVCPNQSSYTNPIADFRGLLGVHQIPVYGGFDFGFGNQTHFPESLRGICSSLCLVHSHGDISLRVNGQDEKETWHRHQRTGAFRSEIFQEFTIQHSDKEARPAQENCRTFKVSPNHLQPGPNELTIVNRTSEVLKIERVNLALW